MNRRDFLHQLAFLAATLPAAAHPQPLRAMAERWAGQQGGCTCEATLPSLEEWTTGGRCPAWAMGSIPSLASEASRTLAWQIDRSLLLAYLRPKCPVHGPACHRSLQRGHVVPMAGL